MKKERNHLMKNSIVWDVTLCSPYQNFLAALTLKMDVTCPSKTSVDFQQTAHRYIPEDRTLHNHQCENLKSCKSSDDLCINIFVIIHFVMKE
jgi:hypothetical protein